MITVTGDTVTSPAADTLTGAARGNTFSIGRFLPLAGENVMTTGEMPAGTTLRNDIIQQTERVEGEPLPAEEMNSDFGFIILSISLLLLTLLTVIARKSVFTGLSSLSFRKQPAPAPPGTSEVLTWPPIIRNIFSALNISLFATLSLLFAGNLKPDSPAGSVWLTAIFAGSFLAGVMMRHLTSIVTAELTGWKNPLREYMNVIYNVWFTNALLLFILNAVIIFSPLNNPLPVIIAGLAGSAILIIIRALRLLIIFRKRHISILYYILYLCALEVLPLLVILKTVGVF
ncbi:MAG: DUF4271 domain-containing protein [Bacteroidales bacterium]|nr:DUF4271 domain-containing protein [Bacteroidales bacterium]MDT8373679.1 DUF4271 domain-containing protein [Bacteroidales bacterium]